MNWILGHPFFSRTHLYPFKFVVLNPLNWLISTAVAAASPKFAKQVKYMQRICLDSARLQDGMHPLSAWTRPWSPVDFYGLVFDILHNIRNIYCASEGGNGLFSPQKRVLGWEMTGMRCQVKDWVAQLKLVNPSDQDSGGRN